MTYNGTGGSRKLDVQQQPLQNYVRLSSGSFSEITDGLLLLPGDHAD